MSSSTSHATLRYTTLRLSVFLGCLVLVSVLAYVGVLPEGIGKSNPFWVVLLAIVLSAPLSFVLLRRQRDAMSEQITGGVGRAKERLAANRSMEDADVDAASSAQAADDAESAGDSQAANSPRSA